MLLALLFHALCHRLEVQFVGICLVVGFICFGIRQISVTDKFYGFILQYEHQIRCTLKHLLHVNRHQLHWFYTRLYLQCRFGVYIGALGIKEPHSPIPILLVDSPHNRLFHMRISPSKFIKPQQVQLLKEHRTGGDTQRTFHNARVEQYSSRYFVPCYFVHFDSTSY